MRVTRDSLIEFNSTKDTELWQLRSWQSTMGTKSKKRWEGLAIRSKDMLKLWALLVIATLV